MPLQGPPLYRPFLPGETRPNADGSYSTELSVTMQLPSGEWVNVPSLWMGPEGPTEFDPSAEDQIMQAAADYESLLGSTFSRFPSLNSAEAAAVARSNAGGAGAGGQDMGVYLGYETPDYAPIPTPRPGGMGGLGGVPPQQSFLRSDNFGNILQALGVAVGSGPRNAPLSGFAPALLSVQQASAERRNTAQQQAAMEQALIEAGMSPEQARVMAANPQAAKFTLEQQQQRREQEAAQAQRGQTMDFLTRNDPEIAAMVEAGLPVSEGFNLYVKKRQGGGDNEYAQRAQAAQEYGLQPGTKDYQNFILTGKLATEEDRGLSATESKEVWASEDEIPLLDNTIESLALAKDLNDKTFTGATAGTRGWIGTAIPGGDMLVDGEAARATSEFGKLMSMEAIQAMAQTLKGATTDRELARFVEILADPSTPPDIRGRTIDRMKTLAERVKQVKLNRIRELRGEPATPSTPSAGGGYKILSVE